MPSNVLTDTVIRRLSSHEKGTKHFDGLGLFLFVSPAGGKIWRLQYRIDGKQQTKTIGPYPLISLQEARKRRDELRVKVIDGTISAIVPSIVPTKVTTLTASIDAYWSGRRDISATYIERVRNAMARHIEPFIGAKDIKDISRQDLLDQLNRMDAAGLHEFVRKVRMWVSQVFDYAVEQKLCSENIAALIKPEKAFGKTAVKNHPHLKIEDVHTFMARLALEKQELQSVLGCHLLALTWTRTTELRTMQWSEIDGDLWRIPAGKMKRKNNHIVPLCRQALEILEKARFTGRGSMYVFPNDRRIDRPMSENAILYMIHGLGYKGQMSGHGWRSVASTWANEAGYPPDAIERQLAHNPENETRSAYNHAAYLPVRKKMIQDFADWLYKTDPDRLER